VLSLQILLQITGPSRLIYSWLFSSLSPLLHLQRQTKCFPSSVRVKCWKQWIFVVYTGLQEMKAQFEAQICLFLSEIRHLYHAWM